MLDVDSVVKSLRWAQKERHDKLLNELGQLRSLVGRANQPVALRHSKSAVEIAKRRRGKENKAEPELPSEIWPRKEKARDQDPDNRKKDKHKDRQPADKKGKAFEKKDLKTQKWAVNHGDLEKSTRRRGGGNGSYLLFKSTYASTVSSAGTVSSVTGSVDVAVTNWNVASGGNVTIRMKSKIRITSNQQFNFY